jgi:hypothetical protein
LLNPAFVKAKASSDAAKVFAEHTVELTKEETHVTRESVLD